jgi:hypothetical protein
MEKSCRKTVISSLLTFSQRATKQKTQRRGVPEVGGA